MARLPRTVSALVVLGMTILEAQTHPSRDAVSVLSDGVDSEMYVAAVDARTREMTSYQFYETRPDLGEVDLLKRVEWDVPVPPGAQLFIATAGQPQGLLNAFWLGWRDQNSVSALSVFQEAPARAALVAGDRLIAAPIVAAGSRKLHYYFWRGSELYRLEFTGELGKPSAVETVRLAAENVAPSVFASRAVPGRSDDHEVVGFVTTRPTALEAGVVFIAGREVHRVAGDPVAGYLPLERQKPGIHVGADEVVTVGFVAQHRETKAYAVIETTCDRVGKCSTSSRALAGVPPASLHSAAVIYYERRSPRQMFVLVLESRGRLSEAARRGLRPLRENVDLQYSFPILTTIESRYEARLAADGRPTLVALD